LQLSGISIMDRYILNGHEPVYEPDMIKWAKWFGSANRIVARTRVGRSTVSTVFLGIDHSFGFEEQTPILFETMIRDRNGEFHDDQWRYETWDEAEAHHHAVVGALQSNRLELPDPVVQSGE